MREGRDSGLNLKLEGIYTTNLSTVHGSAIKVKSNKTFILDIDI